MSLFKCFMLCTVFVLIALLFSIIQVDGHRHHGHGHGHHHYHGGANGTQCSQSYQVLSQWFPQSSLASNFKAVCRQLGETQAWNILQGILGVPVTGIFDQTTFQALLNNGSPDGLSQTFLNLSGVSNTLHG